MGSKEIIVLVGASGIQGWLPTYITQLSSAGIPVHIENLANALWLDRGGRIGEKIEAIRRLLERFGNYRHVVFSDGFDVQFFGTKEALLARMPDGYVLHAAEKNCYPDSGLATQIPDRGPWRFANGGLAAGSPKAFLDWTTDIQSHPLYDPGYLDQHFMNILLAEQSPLCQIDYQTNLFFCLFGGYDELDFVNSEPVNMLYDTWPLFVHANGKWSADEMLVKYEGSLLL